MNLKIINHSTTISDSELIYCLHLLPTKYNILDNKIFIFDSYFKYLLYSLRHFNLISFFGGFIDYILSLFSSSSELGFYYRISKNIYMFEDRIFKLLEKKLKTISSNENYNELKPYITNDLLNSYKFMWSKYILLDCIIHELTHAIQHVEKRLHSPIIYLSSKWDTINNEIEAVSMCIDVFNANQEYFLDILKVTGIKVNHSLTPLNINYKLNIKIPESTKK